MLANKVALITGASSGIGAATAELFAQNGASLILTGRKLENLLKTAEKCESKSSQKPICITADLANESDVQRLVDEIEKKTPRLDILVNNAGILEKGTIENTTLQQYDTVMNINVRSIFHLTMLLVKRLKESKGSIVNVSSVNGIRSFPGVLAYNMSKAAVDQFTRCVALELAPYQVRVNSVNPGVTVTELHKRGGMDDEAYIKFLDHSKGTHALGRAGDAMEVAKAVMFLASDNASFITGASIPVDGGRHAMCPR